MVPNRQLLASKCGLIRSLSLSGRLTARRSSPNYACSLRQWPQSSPNRALFSSTSRSLGPTSSTPRSASAPGASSTAPSVSGRRGAVVSQEVSTSAAAAAAAATTSSNHHTASLPFSYDPTGLSTKAVKTPSCDDTNLKNSFYRRKLPEHLVSFTSPEGKQLFREMLEEGYGEGYFTLVGNFTTQSEPAFCGPSSLAMVLNSLEVDPQRQWKGAWRWYSDELLECCAPSEQVKAKGITFNQFACLSKCHCDVKVRRANQVSLEDFKRDLEMVCSRADIHMVVSFSRKSLGQTGDGHFSPIGGYVSKAGMVLVLDTARFKYPSYFVSVERLYESLFPIDAETGTSRGYFLLSANPDQPAISLCKIPKSKLTNATTTSSSTLTAAQKLEAATADIQRLRLDASGSAPTTQDIIRTSNIGTAADTATSMAPATENGSSICTSVSTKTNTSNNAMDSKMSWTSMAQTFCKDLPSRIQTENPQTLDKLISVVLQGVPQEYAFWISQQQAHRLKDTTELIDSIKSTELYSLVSSAFPAPVVQGVDANTPEARMAMQQHDGALVFGTLFLMSSPNTLFLTLPTNVYKQYEKLWRAALEDEGQQHRILKEEVERMRSGIVELVNSFCACVTKTGPAVGN